MKAQAQRVQMAEDLQCHLTNGALGNAGKEDFAQFGEQRRRKAQRAVERQQQGGQGEGLLTRRQAIDHFLEDQGHADVGDLGRNQAGERRNDPHAVGPEVGE